MPRIQLFLSGTVQGVGLRPQVLRAARALGLSGFVCNLGGRVEVQAQGEQPALERLIIAMRQLEPPARVDDIERSSMPERSELEAFRILESAASLTLPALPADLAPCRDCLAELAQAGRRAAYPFTACAACGPRYSIVQALPYDRATTTLAAFPICKDCQREYDTLDDRRLHAQAIACPACGPTLELSDGLGRSLARGRDALAGAVRQLKAGRILALKGVGGFQLLCDAGDADAVQRLRERKRREEKPFAVLFADLAAVSEHAHCNAAELALLSGPEAPIVLLRQRSGAARPIAELVAPGNPQLGCLLPASPLHYLLVRAAERPLVCTSGNSSGEPLCIETLEALDRLRDIADVYLVHDRVIARPLDDSVARLGPHGPVLLRRSRGFAPRVVARLPENSPTVLALGAELKAAPALLVHGQLVLGPHVGDLGEARTLQAYKRNVADLLSFFAAKPDLICCDLHPDYASSQLARELSASWGAPLRRIQHHQAHVAAVMVERELDGPVLGLAWDGVGLGTDETIWGGEALSVSRSCMQRVARLPIFPLLGGDAASREPRRCALGVLFATEPALAAKYARAWYQPHEAALLLRALERQLNCPKTSSVGRLFDAVAALSGDSSRVAFEGQAAMRLEFAARELSSLPAPYELELDWWGAEPRPFGLDALVRGILSDLTDGVPERHIAGRFHASLISAAVRTAERAALSDVVLTGGCFQNLLLLEGLSGALEARGHRVHLAGQIPPNDGGVAAGQIAIAVWSPG
jgi:hydrogenase maturation protein HypF